MIVCNAGPLIALAGVGQLALLRELFDEVLIAEEVRREVEVGGERGVSASLIRESPWLRVSSLEEKIDPLLASLLDVGEAATIALAVQKSAALVLIDEVKGRRVARNVYGLAVIGTARVLVEAKRARLIDHVGPLLEQMRGNGYWIADGILDEILRQAGE